MTTGVTVEVETGIVRIQGVGLGCRGLISGHAFRRNGSGRAAEAPNVSAMP